MMGKDEDKELRETWVCESCGEVYVGVDPPEECKNCQGRFFDNLYDMVNG